jgi:transposase-like protein
LREQCYLILRFLRLERERSKRISWSRYYQEDRSVSRSDSFQALEGLTQAVLAGNAIQQKMLEVQWKMLAAVNKTNDQLEKVEVAIRRQRVLLPAPAPPAWNRYNRPYNNRRNFTRSPTPDLINLRSVVRRRSESPP